MGMPTYLVVANQTLGGTPLVHRIQEILKTEGPGRIHVLVPASPPAGSATWTEGEAEQLAQERLDRALEKFAGLGIEAQGHVGDQDPLAAIRDCLLEEEFARIILSTLPPGPSRWLKRDLPHQVERTTDVPVDHVIGESEEEGSQSS